jgi:hypothetical protein
MNADCERTVGAELVAQIEALAPKPGTIRLLPPYIEKTGARAGSLTPADRMLLARLERLS